MRRNDVFDFDGGDILAARDNYVLFTVSELDDAAGMHDSQVSRMEVTAFKGRGCSFGVVVVPTHDDISAHNHFAHVISVGGHVFALIVNDATGIRVNVRVSLSGEEPAPRLNCVGVEHIG